MLPLYSVVPVLGVLAVRVEEDVLVDASTEAEHVGRRMFARLQHLQHHAERLLPVAGTVPPTHIQGCSSVTERARIPLHIPAAV